MTTAPLGSERARLLSHAARWSPLLAALAAGVMLARSWRIDYPYSIDFQAYWLAGSRVASGRAADLYAPGGGAGAGTPQNLPGNEFKNLPIVSLAFVPLAGLDYGTAKRVFWWVDLASLAGSALLLGTHVLPRAVGGRRARALLVLALLLAVAPAHTALRHAQTTPLVLLLLSGYLAASFRGRSALAGVLLALASLVKLPVLAIVALDLWRGRFRSFLAWSAATAAAVALSLALFGARAHREYWSGLTANAGTVMTGHNNQSALAVAARLADPGAPVYDWTPRPVGPWVWGLATVLALALAGLLLAGLGGPRRAVPDEGMVLEVSAALTFGILVLPVAWDHYFLLLAPGLVGVAAATDGRRLLARPLAAAAFLLALAALAIPTPQLLLDGAAGLGLAGAVLLSHYFLGAALLMGLALGARRLAPAERAAPAR